MLLQGCATPLAVAAEMRPPRASERTSSGRLGATSLWLVLPLLLQETAPWRADAFMIRHSLQLCPASRGLVEPICRNCELVESPAGAVGRWSRPPTVSAGGLVPGGSSSTRQQHRPRESRLFGRLPGAYMVELTHCTVERVLICMMRAWLCVRDVDGSHTTRPATSTTDPGPAAALLDAGPGRQLAG